MNNPLRLAINPKLLEEIAFGVDDEHEKALNTLIIAQHFVLLQDQPSPDDIMRSKEYAEQWLDQIKEGVVSGEHEDDLEDLLTLAEHKWQNYAQTERAVSR